MFVIVLLLFSTGCLLAQDSQYQPQLVIGGLFYEDEAEDLKVAMNLGSKAYNFTPVVKEVGKRGEILEVSGHVCELAQEGVIGIIDGLGGHASEHVQALCDMLELPHVLVQPNDLYAKNWSLINMFPSADAYNMVLTNLISLKEWENFTILYVKGHNVKQVQDVMEMEKEDERYTISVRELSGDDYRDVLLNAKENGYYNFVVDCTSRHLEQLLEQAQQVDLMADEHSYIFVSPDLFTLDLSPYRYGGVNMTGFRLMHLESSQDFWDFTAQFNEEKGDAVEPEQIKTKTVLVYDALRVFHEATKKVNVTLRSLSCEEYEAWSDGSSLLNFMKTNRVDGLTRSLLFDGLGQRNDVYFDILELTPAGNQSIGTWKDNELTITRPLLPPLEVAEDSIMKNKTFKVLFSTTPPYGFIKESEQELEGNDRYEGFAIDLIDMISEKLGFSYEFEIEDDYGGIDQKTGKWTGMVKLLREEKADFAICDLTITAERQSGIDFSTPFMTTGIGILYKEPSKQPPPMFSFMAVFSTEVWLYMVFVQMGIGTIMIFVGRISYKEWQNPVPCIESPEELSNQFSFANSIWLIIGSVMQQGSEIAPIALGPRIITSVWWFFTMVMVASYVGTLVAFLTVEKNVYPFENVQQLYEHKSTAYGAKDRGSTILFFEKSQNKMYNDMHKKMIKNKWVVSNNDDGVRLAENSSYAFFMEQTSIEYTKERHCDLMQIGGMLDTKSYGIGMKKGSPYKRYIDDALLKLKERGEIQRLKDLWWKEKRGGGKCEETRNEDPKQLDMKNMIGAFVVLGAGCLIGLVISTLDMLWGVFKRSVKYNTTFKYELIEELKFALKFSGDVKPVKRPPKSAEGSAEALADAEAREVKDELGSLRSATVRSMRSGRSTSTHRSHHSHSSRHSSGGLSVAFARRREYL